MTHEEIRARFEERIMAPLTRTSRAWMVWMGILLALIMAGTVAYATQLKDGLAVTGLNDNVTWGVYISNFVFFSGLGMAGTFISGILRLTGAEWRRPLTRFAELSTVAALTICAIMPAIDMGRPDRVLHLLMYGRLESPLLWDIMVIPTYLTASIIYLFLFLIPDSAILRDKLGGQVSGARRKLYTAVGMKWQALPEQRRRIERAGTIMAVLIIPIGIATHSVVSWIFGMTYRSGWDSTIFAPYFAVGALYSGTAILITLMYVFRRVYRLEDFLTERHFKLLATLMVVFGVAYLYFTFAEFLTMSYKMEASDGALINQLFFGRYAAMVWFGFIGGQIVPVVLAALPWTRKVKILVFASVLVNLGMWLKRLVIVVPSMSAPLLPYEWGAYTPSTVEILITIASFAGFAFIMTVFAKFFPIISIDEMEEGWELEETSEHSTAGAKAPVTLKPQVERA